MSDPVVAFVKYAEAVRVRPHTRIQEGKLVLVDAHQREQEKKPSGPLEGQQRRDRDLELWERWRQTRSDEDLEVLMRAFEPMVQSKAMVYKGKVRIPDHAIDLMYRKTLVEAFENYDPSKGAALSTYVYYYLDKVKRWIGSNQNIGRIPENRLYRIKEFQQARSELAENLGTPPTDKQLAAHLGWSEKEVDRMRSELRSDLVAQNFEGDPYAFTPSRTESTLRLFTQELSGQERILYEHLMGYGRPRVTEPGKLAEIMGVEGYKISRMKKSIANKLERYVDE